MVQHYEQLGSILLFLTWPGEASQDLWWTQTALLLSPLLLQLAVALPPAPQQRRLTSNKGILQKKSTRFGDTLSVTTSN